MPYNVKDGSLTVSVALPAAAGAVATPSIDLGAPSQGAMACDFVAPCELVIDAPAMSTTQLPNTATMTYAVQTSDDDQSWTTVDPAVLVQTGAGGTGAAAAEVRYRFPTNVKRYVQVLATGSAAVQGGTAAIGSCAAATLVAALAF